MKKDKSSIQKSGLKGNKMWNAHRLEGVVKNKAIKMTKKKQQPKPRPKLLAKNHNPDKVSIPTSRSALLVD